jgi:SAM-dependent methyltransferase
MPTSQDDSPIALAAYEQLAQGFAERIETKPHNAYYERPATLALLGDVRGLRVLDAGCGPGAYTARLLDQGASVVALDVSPAMVDYARVRAAGRAEVHVADLAAPLDFLTDHSFDVVLSPLTLEYVRDWRATLAEFHRVLAPGGRVVVSVTHPQFDVQYYQSTRYFDVERVSAEWSGFGTKVRVPSYRRSLAETLNPFFDAGFVITRVVEPRPTEEFKRADPRHYAELMAQPAFLCIEAVRRDTAAR